MNNDKETERVRLSVLYAGMTDDELINIACDLNALTDVARGVMTSELEKRGLQLPEVEAQSSENDSAMTQKIVVVAHFMDMPQALIAKATLDASGVEAFLAHDNINRLYPSSLAGGIRLEVAENDAQQAIEVLNEPMPSEFEVEGVGEYHQPICPACGAVDVELVAQDRDLNLQNWTCTACGNVWIPAADDE